jgi:hypothetical protein
MPPRPPVLTLLHELLSWTIDRCQDFPKSYRTTLTDRIMGLTLDAVERALEAAFLPPGPGKKAALVTLNLTLEKLRFLWRVVHERRFISAQQHQFVCLKVDEIGKMVGGWLKSLETRK